jgi:homoserine dehydrogenase
VSRLPLTVLKLGGSVLRSEADLPAAVHEIYRWTRHGRVVVVTSAFAGATDALLGAALRQGPAPDAAALASLLGTGEHASAALLTLALDRAGVSAVLLDVARAGILTEGPVLEADPVSLDVAAVERALQTASVAVVPGFVGRTPDGVPSLLGRGGSDLTALFLAARLGAERCRLLKDVGGVHETDPAHTASRIYRRLAWADAERLEGRVIQRRALRFAREHDLAFEVAALHAEEATVVDAGPSRFAVSRPRPRPVKVGLLGLGTVGLGVYQHLAALPDLFEVTGIAVQRVARHRDHAPRSLLTDDAFRVIDGAEVVVEAVPGREAAAPLVTRALGQGRHVVTANKALVAAEECALRKVAARHGAELRFSAAVGGAVPVLETLSALGKVRCVEGVLNGTSGYVLDRVAEGHGLDAAVRLAQEAGFAEADPTADLDGRDLEAKLRIVSRAAFGEELASGERRGVDAGTASSDGSRRRLVGRIERGRATVRPEALAPDHPLAGLRGEANGVVVHLEDGAPVVLLGRGAGRWPTAEAVLADLLDLARESGRAEAREASA